MSDLDLDIKIHINTPEAAAAAKKIRDAIKGIGDSAEQEAARADKAFSKLTTTLTGVFSAAAVKHFVSELIEVRGQFQQIENSLTTILKSQDAANALMTEWKDLTLRSPYTLSEIAQSGKQLLAYGVDAKNVTKNIEQLANVASGVSQPLGDIAYLYGTLKTQGRAYQMDINQFTNRGIPIVAELAKVMKVADSEVRRLVEAGKVGFPEVEKAISNMTSAGGQFFNLIGKQSETLPGQINRLKHEWELMLNEIGTKQEGVLAGGIGQLANLVEHYEKVIDILKVLVITYGAYRTAIILNTIATSGASAVEVLHYGLLVLKDKLVGILTAKMGGLTVATAAYTAVLAALAVVAYAGIQYQTAAEIAEDSLTKAREKGERAATKEQQRIEKLIKVIKDHNATKQKQIEAYEELKSSTNGVVDRFSIEEVAAGKADKALKSYSNTVKNLVSAETEYAQYKDLETKLKDLEEQGIKAIGMMDKLWVSIKRTFAPWSQGMNFSQWTKELFSSSAAGKGIVDGEMKKLTEAQDKILKGANGKGVQKLIDGRGKIITVEEDEEIKRAKQFARDLGDVIGNFDKLVKGAKNKSDISKIKEAITAKIEALAPNDPKINEYKEKLKRINAIEAQYGLSGDSKSAKEAEKWADKRAALLDKIAKKSADVSAKGKTDNDKEIQEARNRYAELRSELEKFNKSAPKGQRLGAGTFAMIDGLEKTETGSIEYNQATDKLKETLDKQKSLYNDFEDYKKALGEAKAKERFAKQLDTEKTFLQVLEAELKTLDGIDLTGAQQKRKEMLVNEIEAEKLTRQQANDRLYAEAYTAAIKHEESILLIKQKYANFARILGDKITADQKANLLRQMEDEIKAANNTAFQKSELFKKLSKEIATYTASALREEVKALENILKDSGLDDAVRRQIEADLKKLQGVLKNGVFNSNLAALEEQKKNLEAAIVHPLKAGTEEAEIYRKKLIEVQKQIDGTKKGGSLESMFNASFGGGTEGGIEDIIPGGKELKAVLQTVSKSFGAIASSTGELATAFEGVNDELAHTLRGISDVAGVVSNITGKLADGDLLGAITAGIAGFMTIGKRVKEMNAAARAEMQKFYDDAIKGETAYNTLVRLRERESAAAQAKRLKGLKEEFALLKGQSTDINTQYEDLLKKLQGEQQVTGSTYTHGTWFRKAKTEYSYAGLQGMGFDELEKLYTQGKLTDGAKALFEQLKKLKDEGADVSKALEDVSKKATEIFTGTNSDSLRQGFLQLFKDGKTSAADFAEFLKEKMKDASYSIFEDKILAKMMDEFYAKWAEAGADDILDDTEIANLQALFAKIGQDAKTEFDKLQQVTGLDLKSKSNSANTIRGNVENITAKQADVLSGNIAGLRLDMSKNGAEQLLAIKQQNALQIEISANTLRTANNTDRLVNIESSLKSMDNKMSSSNAAIRAQGGTP